MEVIVCRRLHERRVETTPGSVIAIAAEVVIAIGAVNLSVSVEIDEPWSHIEGTLAADWEALLDMANASATEVSALLVGQVVIQLARDEGLLDGPEALGSVRIANIVMALGRADGAIAEAAEEVWTRFEGGEVGRAIRMDERKE